MASSSTGRSTKHSSTSRKRLITVHVTPTLGGKFPMSCSPYLSIERFKEDISDRLGISPKKMSLLHRSEQLKNGTLNDNGVIDGSEIKLVPCLESGVNTPLSMDPVSMMKHSMSNITDHQIDDFLAGKSPLSVAIRLGESVVVVNLNRAKVEEVEMEPPPEKKRNSPSYPSTSKDTTSLNTNPHWSSTACATTPAVTPSTTTPPCHIRSVVPVGVPVPSNEVGGAPLDLTPPTNTTPAGLLIHDTLHANRRRRREQEVPPLTPSLSQPLATSQSSLSSLSRSLPSTTTTPTTANTESSSNTHMINSRPIKKATRRSHHSMSSSKSTTSKTNNNNKLQLSNSDWEDLKRLREIPSSQNSVSMKRKAVMEAIGEILKKMYAQRIKGKVPGTFKGRFSSEFTCDNDMQDIIHSKTTMTSYGEMMNGVLPSHLSPSNKEACTVSQARFRENEELKDKMALLKWRMQQQKVLRKRRRTNGATPTSSCAPSPAGSEWLEEEELDCELPPPKLRKKTGFCGLKRGFLLAD